MHRCAICRRPMQFEYVEMPRIGLDGKVVQYRNVRRYSCPEGCRGIRLDFSQARPASSDVRPKVVPVVKPLKKEPDFNDRLLAFGLIASYVILVAAIVAVEAAWTVKGGGIALLTLCLLAVYRFANKRVVLPNYFPVPLPAQDERPQPAQRPEPPPQQQRVPEPAPAAVAAASAPAAPAPAAAPAAAPAGGGIPMKVILGGQEYNLDVSPRENMLSAALDRNVDLDYSCLEGLCDSCEVRVLAGMENISPPKQSEFDMLGEEEVKAGKRLACQVIVNGPVTIEQ